VVKVGVIWMAREEILENVMRAINRVVENLPRKWTGLQPLIST
jgi:ribosomal protein L1